MKIPFVGGPYNGDSIDLRGHRPNQLQLMLGGCGPKPEDDEVRKALRDHVGSLGKTAEGVIVDRFQYVVAAYTLSGNAGTGWSYHFAGWTLGGSPSTE